ALPLPLGQAFTAEAAMKIMIAMSFMFAFCRRRWSELASAFGAVSFGYCTFVQTWLHFPLVTVAVFIPAAFLTLDLLLERPTRLRFMGVVAVWAVMLLGGHPLSAALLRPRAAGESVGTGGRRVDHRIRGRPRRRRVVRTVDPRDRAAALAESGDVLRLRQRDRPGNHSRVAGGEQSVSPRLRPGGEREAATAPLLASSGWNPVLPVKRSYPTTPLIDRLMDIRKKTPSHAPFRIVGIGPSLFPNIQAIYGLEDVRAHDPMANGRYLGVLRVVTGYDTANYFAKWEN